ncbi:MAG: ATP synthase F1 subunit epsilon, partial [Ruminococcus sp.]|nr:ATP synthase F1 subunit epsilon [Ruminococcus sp.]
MNSFKLEIYATDGCFYNGDCEHLIFGSADGSRGVMAGHE